jgi:S-DNA-T family DNA segregation ATPase FtsK/SpoIIIE
MKPSRQTVAPTGSRRLNEMLGLLVLAGGTLLLLALVSYTPSDPSLNSIGGSAAANGFPAHSARNWTGLAGAYTSDLLLQVLGIASFFLPIALLRWGIAWLRSRPAGPVGPKLLGLLLWTLFAPAAIALLPGNLLWRHALPICGVAGRILSDYLVQLLNLPGAIIVCSLAVALSLYLSTTFLLSTARLWLRWNVTLLRGAIHRFFARRGRRQAHGSDLDNVYSFIPKDDAATGSGAPPTTTAPSSWLGSQADEPTESHSLLSSLFGWFGRRKHKPTPEDDAATIARETSASIWKNIPRLQLDPESDVLLPAGLAAAGITHLSDEPELNLRAQPLTTLEPVTPTPAASLFGDMSRSTAPTPEPKAEDNWLDAPERRAPAPILPKQLPPMPSPMADLRDQNIAFGKRADADLKAVVIAPKSVRGYKLPPSSLLFKSEEHTQVREAELREEAAVLVQKCAEFGVDGTVTQINPGPVVTTFEFKPDAGVKVARITSLADDLCLAMAAESILIERMAGKSTVGIQVPNRNRETIWLRDVVECESFAASKSRLAIALGKDISGRIVTHDLASMPHVLIAGSTGSGKSVAINAMIMSVLYKSTPEQVRMILVDPKRVELGMYEGIPHLFTPIITEAKLAANALRNAVREMERRLKLLAANHVRNIDQFNKLFEHGSDYLFEDVNQEPLPYIMIIIDELADLMMLDRANVEEAITRIAQMARAVGIHLVLATQRPSVDVITGLLKANVPTRMSFRLATKVDSRTIIDSNGAESLLGRGDMLFLPPGTSRLQRVHAPFVTEKEIAAVTEFWRAQGEADYATGFLEAPKDDKGNETGSANDGDDNDPMFDDAVRLIFEFGKASTSLLQRRLRIGYGRAAHLIDMMEKDGLVGPADGSKPREILKAPSFYAEVDAALR